MCANESVLNESVQVLCNPVRLVAYVRLYIKQLTEMGYRKYIVFIFIIISREIYFVLFLFEDKGVTVHVVFIGFVRNITKKLNKIKLSTLGFTFEYIALSVFLLYL